MHQVVSNRNRNLIYGTVRLCYNGTLEESVKGATLPQAADCISKTDAKCHTDQSTASNLGYPSHMLV